MRYAGFFALVASLGMVGCSSEADHGGSTTDSGALPDVPGIDTKVPVDTGSPAIDSGTVDSTTVDSATVDSAIVDSGTADSSDSSTVDSTTADSGSDTKSDSGTDTYVADTYVADTYVADTYVADTYVADTYVADTAVADTGADTGTFGPRPTFDGVVSTGEYGDHSAGKNAYASSTQTWYASWDDEYLYVALTNANLAEGVVLYLDKLPLSPPTSGTNVNGNLAGQTYDGARYATLPIRADLVVYAKDGYREYRVADGAGGWGTATTAFGLYGSAGTTREIAVPWSALGGRPASFAFFAYAVSASGYVYGQAPSTLTGGAIGTTATASAYFLVSSSAPGGTKPFASPLP